MTIKGYCPNCKISLRSDEKVCPVCGAVNEGYFDPYSISKTTVPQSSPLNIAKASTGYCSGCGASLRSDEKTCPVCGAPNHGYLDPSLNPGPTVPRPKTLKELKAFTASRRMPLEKMRFFIDWDYREPKAFGIYRDGEIFVVYKNKADGSRAVRYRGPDEARAVGELYDKLLSECHNRGIYPELESFSGPGTRSIPLPQDSVSTDLNEPIQIDPAMYNADSTRKPKQSWSFSSRVKLVLYVIFLIFLLTHSRSCGFSFSSSSDSSSGYRYESSSFDDDDDWDWDSDDSDWDSDW